MVEAGDEVKKHVIEVLETLPEEALAEVATFVDYQRFKLAQRQDDVPPYRPIPLGGLWKGIRITDEDIEAVRREMWGRFSDREP